MNPGLSTAVTPVSSHGANHTSHLTDVNDPVNFSAFYDKYAPAFYGEIKRRLYKEDVSQKVLEDVFKKIYHSGELYASKDKLFITVLRLVRKEISFQKINIALKQIMYKRTHNQQVEL